ncbi:MAG: bifunctional [glutamate--ammonia ligase]-adenylyl-L-tyrosine phosphorylase/[glutamate--ammonia-ligase] adenylyltransferase [Deltaproteobacteria bacterium]
MAEISGSAGLVGIATHFAADPELAVARAADLDGGIPRVAALTRDAQIALFAVLGGSAHLSRVLIGNPDWAQWLARNMAGREPMPQLDAEKLLAAPEQSAALLRRWRQRSMLRIGSRDLWGMASVRETLVALSEMAECAITLATRLARAEVEREHGLIFDAQGRPARFVVLGLGKLGARELNYSSDVDLVFVHDGGDQESRGGPKGGLEARVFFTRMAERITRLLSEVQDEGFVFRVDLRLRPDGRNGALTTSREATLQYYATYGQTWERAAFFKARPVGGDLDLGDELLTELASFIYRRTLDYSMIADLESMKAEVEREARGRGDVTRNVKLGPGGIREVEFFAQSFSMVHGGLDPRLREPGCLDLLGVLAEVGHLPAAEAAALAAAYRWLRRVEHAVQLQDDRQVHSLPASSEERRVVARRLACHLTGRGPIWRRMPVGGALGTFDTLHAHHTATVRHAFADLFRDRRAEALSIADERARDLIASLDGDDATTRAATLGFAEPDAAVAALRLLRDGGEVPARSVGAERALRELSPALLEAVLATSAPDRALGLLAEFLRRVGARRSFLSLLAENRATLRLLIRLFATSEFLSRRLLAQPELLDVLVRSDLAKARKTREDLRRELAGRLAAAQGDEASLDALRRFHNDESLRIGINDIEGSLHWAEVSEQLSDLAETSIIGAYDLARGWRESRHGVPAGAGLVVVAMGRLGSRELNYHSDLDLVFVHGADPGAAPGEGLRGLSEQEFFARLAQTLMGNLQLRTREGYAYRIDTRLRPSGNSGALVSSLAGFRRYHRESSAIWERQALIRARVVCGSPDLALAVSEVIAEFVYGRGLDERELVEIVMMRARMERETANEDALHLNLRTGRGGLVDIEFLAQVLALQYGHADVRLRQRATRPLLDAAAEAGVLGSEEHAILIAGHSFLRGLENRLRIEGEQPVLRVGRRPAELASVARRMGIEAEGARAGKLLLETWDRHRDAVRRVYEQRLGHLAPKSEQKS